MRGRGDFCTRDICWCYSLCQQRHSIGDLELRGIYFWESLKNLTGIALFLGSGLTAYQTATSKWITYFTTTFNSSWRRDYCLAVTSSSGGKFGLKINENLFLEDCHWRSVRVINIQGFWNYELNYTIMGEVWGESTPYCLKVRKQSGWKPFVN